MTSQSDTQLNDVTDETGWLIEENSPGVIHWIALSDDGWPRTKLMLRNGRGSRMVETDRYRDPIRRVKDAADALRFARQEDADAFIKLFSTFLLIPKATEHVFVRALEPLTPGGLVKSLREMGQAQPFLLKAADAITRLLADNAAKDAALRGLLAEFEKFSRYGSPIAMQANEAVQEARTALQSKG